MIGERLAHYRIVDKLGQGGMGEVYRAEDTKLRREVAIKILPEAFAKDADRVARFEREARLLASLNHPGIATLHGLEKDEGVHYLVMELVAGETLAERIARGPLPLEEALDVFRQIAEALEAAHEKGVIHRDLKPANIKITPEGKVKVLDFGLAKAYGEEEAPAAKLSESPTITRGTATGMILGTAPYMSPEQARGKSVDKRADIWAYGCCLFEALTGKPAFWEETLSDTMAAILKNEPDWDKLPSSTPPALRRLLRRCLQKDPSRRLRDVGDARIEIEEAESGTTSPIDSTHPVKTRRSVLSPALAALALMTIGIAAGIKLSTWIYPDRSVESSVTRSTILLGEDLAIDNVAPSVAISPNGRYVAYVTMRGESAHQLFLRSLDRLEPVPIEGTETPGMPFFSPDSEWLGFVAGRRLMRVSVRGGAPIAITDCIFRCRGASWGPDGNIIYAPDSNIGLWRIPSDGGEPEVLTIPDRERRERTHRLPEVLPGGKAVLFTLATADIDSFDEASIAVLSLATGTYQVVLEQGTNARYSPTGHIVYARGGRLFAAPFDPTKLQVTGVPVAVAGNVAMTPLEAQAEFAVSARRGSLVYGEGGVFGRDDHVVWVDREGESEPILSEPGGFSYPRVSPDGNRLALRVEGANASIWVYHLERRTFTRLTFPWINVDPIWTPDGSRITFRSSQEGPFNLYWQLADGSAPDVRLTTSENVQRPGSWSPDGETLAFSELSEQTGWDLWTLSLGGDRLPRPFLQTESDEQSPVFSPDGHWIAYVSNESGRDEIYLRPHPAAQGKWPVSSGGGIEPRWSSTGRELFYRVSDTMMVVEVNTDGEIRLGRPRELFVRPSSWPPYDVTPDGQRFVMVDASSKPRPKALVLIQNWNEELNRLVPTN